LEVYALTKREELEIFLERCDEFIDSKYILADVKLASLLKSIASSDTLLALFQNCLNGFDYYGAQKRYLVKNPHVTSDKGEFVLPPNSRELLAFIFTTLVEIDGKRIDYMPSTISELERVKPIYEEMDGWMCETSNITKMEDLPPKAKAYVDRLIEVSGAKLGILSIGPARESTLRIAL
jgi:hypothetical protein